MTALRGPRVTLRAFRPEEIDDAMRRMGGGEIEPSNDGQATRRRARLRSGAECGRCGAVGAHAVLQRVE